VLLPFLDPLLAVVALSTCHVPIVAMERVKPLWRETEIQLSQPEDVTNYDVEAVETALNAARLILYRASITKATETIGYMNGIGKRTRSAVPLLPRLDAAATLMPYGRGRKSGA
jgi:hypothetical protein